MMEVSYALDLCEQAQLTGSIGPLNKLSCILVQSISREGFHFVQVSITFSIRPMEYMSYTAAVDLQ